jgi:hypothetical protein
MSSQVELCEHHTKGCLQAAEKTEDPLAREMLLRHALEWLRDGLTASKHSKLCAVCGRKAAPGSSLSRTWFHPGRPPYLDRHGLALGAPWGGARPRY